MVSLLISLLYWTGALMFYVGVVVFPLTARTWTQAFAGFTSAIVIGGVVCMGIAVTELSYDTPSIMESLAVGVFTWTAIVLGVMVVIGKSKKGPLSRRG